MPPGVDAWDATGRIGLLHMAFPLKMLLQPDGHLTSCDLLHTVAGAIIFDVYENQDARLVSLQIPEQVLRTFPGPAYGPLGLRERTGFCARRAGVRHDPEADGRHHAGRGRQTGRRGRRVSAVSVRQGGRRPLSEPGLFARSPSASRRPSRRSSGQRNSDGGKGLIFAPHITGAPHEMLETLHAVIEAGATGVMFSETFAGGTVRMVREATKHLPNPPAIYGHNAGIGVKTRGGIWREVIDLLARLDGIDFRQTAPVRPGPPFIRPYGAEWEASEEILSRDLPGIKPTMIARAGGLDQGNIILNLADAERRGLSPNILFLAGSAINSVKNAQGQPDPQARRRGHAAGVGGASFGRIGRRSVDDHLARIGGRRADGKRLVR